jgi:CRISPR-associated protein Csx17
MNEIVLAGCTPTPLASYLKALAVLRLVAEQSGDSDATGYWRDDVFVLRTVLDGDALLKFFLDRYAPTPLVAPWNGGSGFYPKDNRQAVDALACAQAARFETYRRAIDLARRVIGELGLSDESPKNEKKRWFLGVLRNRAEEGLLRWMDASVILSDGDPQYPPLLGTGGNDGRLDFTNNFMQRLMELFDFITGKPQDGTDDLLRVALFASPTASLAGCAIGQFAPGSAGGPNATVGFEGNARVNPWDFVLMLEGAVLFAASVVRRLESSSAAVLSAPFTARSRAATAGGAAGGDDAEARGEIWMPLWNKPFSLPELSTLFSEGRAALGTRPTQDGLGFARAVAKLGVERGLLEFQRYGFLMRSGKAFLATPLMRVPVRRNPQADLIDDLDQGEWLPRVQRFARNDKAPSAFRALAMQLEAALFAMIQRADQIAIERVLRLLGRIEAIATSSAKVREQIAPVPPLSPVWAFRVDDSSAEFRIAKALAGLLLRGTRDGKPVWLGLRPHLAPVATSGRGWDESSHLLCWAPGPLERNLGALLHRRRLEAARLDAVGEVFASCAGAWLEDVSCFLEGSTDDRRIAELAHGFACIGRLEPGSSKGGSKAALPSAYFLLKPFFTSEAMLRRLGWLPGDYSLRLPAEVPARLAADDVAAALRVAWQRLGVLGKKLPGRRPPEIPRQGDGPRLLAALSIPLALGETRRSLNQLNFESEAELIVIAESTA